MYLHFLSAVAIRSTYSMLKSTMMTYSALSSAVCHADERSGTVDKDIETMDVTISSRTHLSNQRPETVSDRCTMSCRFTGGAQRGTGTARPASLPQRSVPSRSESIHDFSSRTVAANRICRTENRLLRSFHA